MSEKFSELRGKLPLSAIEVDATFNARKRHDSGAENAAIESLAKSIAERGLLCDLLVRDHGEDFEQQGRSRRYSLVHGFRRLEACRRLDWDKVPCKARVYESDSAAELDNLVENVQREDLRPYDFARRCQDMHRRHGMTYDQIAAHLGTDAQWVQKQVWCIERMPLDLIEAFRESDKSKLGIWMRVIQEPSQDKMRSTYASLMALSGRVRTRQALPKESLTTRPKKRPRPRRPEEVTGLLRQIANGEMPAYQGRALSARERALALELLGWVLSRQPMPLETEEP